MDQRVYALPSHLGTNPSATCHYHTLYFVIFGNLIGSRIGEMGGFSYIEFIVPGLIIMSIITNSYSNVSSSFFSAKFQRNIEELLISPVPTWVIIMGFVGGGVARAILIGIIVTTVSLFFVDVHIHNALIIIITLILTATLFATAGLINGVFAKTFDDSLKKLTLPTTQPIT